MTAEIAIMNREGVALAADSAVTISEKGGQKVFSSANKLFCLSRNQAVGVMVYGSALFMGVPWETVVKVYRSERGGQTFDTLGDYAEDFASFLNGGNPLFPDEAQRAYFESSVAGYFTLMRREIEDRVCTLIDERGRATPQELDSIVSEVVGAHDEKWQ